MNRLEKQIREIADAHIKARVNDKFDDTPIGDIDDLKRNLLQGITYSGLLDEIEMRHSTVTSTLMCRQFGHVSDAHYKAIHKGFKELFKRWY
jgi:hypothetical protein